MGFKKGQPKHPNSGRKKGSRNKRTLEAQRIADEMGVDPLKILLAFANNDWKYLGYDGPTTERVADGGMLIECERIPPTLRQKSAKDAIPFIRPQLKSVDIDLSADMKSQGVLVTNYEDYIRLVGQAEGYEEADDDEGEE